MADITAITAGIGGGKSLLATLKCFEELEKSERFVVCSLPLDLEELADACHRFIKKPVDITKRVRVLTLEESRNWWLYLPGRNLKDMGEVAGRQDTDTFGAGGCLYIVDEMHLIYSARDWQKNKVGEVVEEYISQLRKLKDDFIWITQHREKVDKNFRRNTTQWIVVKNLGKARLLLGVGLPNRFVASVFTEEPSRMDKPEYTIYYERKVRRSGGVLDYGKLYRTMAGVGFLGKLEAEPPPKRRHWSVWIVAAVLLTIAAWFFPRVLSSVTGYAVGHNVEVFRSNVSKAAGVPDLGAAAIAPKVATVVVASPPSTAPAVAVAFPEVDTNVLRVVSFDMLSGRARVFLSNGKSKNAEFVRVGDYAMVDGVKYEWQETASGTGPIPKLEIQMEYDNERQFTKKKVYNVVNRRGAAGGVSDGGMGSESLGGGQPERDAGSAVDGREVDSGRLDDK